MQSNGACKEEKVSKVPIMFVNLIPDVSCLLVQWENRWGDKEVETGRDSVNVGILKQC